MYDVGFPTQLLDGFNGTAHEEDAALVVQFGRKFCFQTFVRIALEIVVVVNEVHLHSGGLQCGNFDNQRVVGVINNQVHTRETDNFMQLVASFVDASVFWHECSHFVASFLHAVRHVVSHY